MVIQGEMNADREIIVTVTLRDPNGDSHDFGGIIDTGFTEHLTLPPEIIEALALPEAREEFVILGDGTERQLRRYTVTIIWEGQEVTTEAYRTEGPPLVGMRLLKGMVGMFHFADGGPATLFRP